MSDKALLEPLAKRIKELRMAKNLTQRQLAYKMGKDQVSIYRLEKGLVNPSYGYLIEIAKGLDMSLTDFLQGITNS